MGDNEHNSIKCYKCGNTIDKIGFTRCTRCIRSTQNSLRRRNTIYSIELENKINTLTEQLEIARRLLAKSRARSSYPTDIWNKQRNDLYEKIREGGE